MIKPAMTRIYLKIVERSLDKAKASEKAQFT